MKVIRVIDFINGISKGSIPISTEVRTLPFEKLGYSVMGILNFKKICESLAVGAIELNNRVEIIEESKEELEEIELLSMHLEDSYVMFENVYAKINDLIENQNKIIRELKANSKQ